MANFEYPEAGIDASPGVKQDIQAFRRLPVIQRQGVPLLYYLLGSGTPPYKMDAVESAYQDEPKRVLLIAEQNCANCSASYIHAKSGNWICDQISPFIAPQGWCRLWRP